MQPDQQTSQALHKKLPIDPDEKVLAIFRHHWFAYVTSWLITAFVIVGIVGLAVLIATSDSVDPQYRGIIIAVACFFGLLVALGGIIPAYLRSQEQLVLTDESLLKLLKPTIFSHKVDQLGLQHVADVSVHQDMIGTLFGFGTLEIETAGEQRTSYDFIMVPNPTSVAQRISEQKEDFDAALQSGRIESKMTSQLPPAPQIDPQEYQEFLQFQQMQRMQQGQATAVPQTSDTQNGAPASQTDSPQPGVSQQPASSDNQDYQNPGQSGPGFGAGQNQ